MELPAHGRSHRRLPRPLRRPLASRPPGRLSPPRNGDPGASPAQLLHTVGATAAILAEVARNQRVREVVRQSLIDIAEDPQVQQLAWGIFRDALLKNERLHETLQRHWRSEEAQRAFAIAAERLEPTVRRIGDLLFGTQETGISPEFALVLRSQILHKDRRWLVLHTPPGEASRVGAALDRLAWPEIVGTLAGDDTIFIATAGRTQQRSFVKRVKKLAT